MDSLTQFQGRPIVIATMHGKEQVIGAHLSKVLGLDCFVTDLLNTDLLGTFSGEINRSEGPLETARKKCNLALDLTSADLAIASEGSFGPHPSIPFIPSHEEILVLVDRKNQWEFAVRKLATQTNYSQITLQSLDTLDAYLVHAKFPSHALIVKKSPEDSSDCVKGIDDDAYLRQLVYSFIERFGQCTVETDMRAMYNPTRMDHIEALTKALIQQIESTCPVCQTPGFRLTEIERGLPCAYCERPTRSTKTEIYSCQICLHVEQRLPSHAMLKEDPMYCDFCNP